MRTIDQSSAPQSESRAGASELAQAFRLGWVTRQHLVALRRLDASRTRDHLVEAQGYSVVRQFVGHGIGRKMHEEPHVPNYGDAGRGTRSRSAGG